MNEKYFIAYKQWILLVVHRLNGLYAQTKNWIYVAIFRFWREIQFSSFRNIVS